MILFITALILIFLSMTFSATESAFLSINKLRVRFLRKKKDKKAVRVWQLLNDKEKLINTLLVGNNIVNISLSAILTVMAIKFFGNGGVGLATLVATLLLLIFGEITPKTIATHHPEPIAFFFSGYIYILEILLSPLVFVFTKISRCALKLFHVDANEKKVSFTEEEIKTFLDVGSEAGVLRRNEKNMMHKVFKFTDLEAKDIMIPRKKIISLNLNSSYQDIIELSERYGLSRFPVCRKNIDDIAGILYIKDLLLYKSLDSNFSVSKVMRSPLFILETKKMSSIQQMLQENHQSMAVVIDEYGGTYGVLTSEDIAREIFGPITDEYKTYARRVEVQIKNTVSSEIDGLSRLVDINEQLGINLQSEMAETIGGYISESLGHIPLEGESIQKDGYIFIVSKMDERRIAKVHFRQLNKEDYDD